MKNKYPGYCIRCDKRVEKGEGHFERVSRERRWAVRCRACVGKGHKTTQEKSNGV